LHKDWGPRGSRDPLRAHFTCDGLDSQTPFAQQLTTKPKRQVDPRQTTRPTLRTIHTPLSFTPTTNQQLPAQAMARSPPRLSFHPSASSKLSIAGLAVSLLALSSFVFLASAQHDMNSNVTDLSGTWSSGWGAVRTGAVRPFPFPTRCGGSRRVNLLSSFSHRDSPIRSTSLSPTLPPLASR
jgi:hypothetical protein